MTSPSPPIPPQTVEYLRWLFSFEELHIRQKVLSIAQKYFVEDSNGFPRFYVVRPPRLAINVALGLFLTVLRVAVLILAYRLAFFQGALITGVLIFVAANWFLGLLHSLLSPYRDIGIFTDDTESWRILTVTQDNKLGLTRDYTLYDCFGETVAHFRRDTFRSILRREWMIEAPDGAFLFRCREDSLPRAVLRRYLGPMYGLLRTNFNLEHGDGSLFGVYNRKLTLRDQYILDLAGDPHRLVDRRVCLAMSILLDTGESR